jgi:transcriptional regulator with XRE-family HTH domain
MANQPRWSQRTTTRLRKAIKASGLSENKLAELAGIPMSTFRRRVRGINPWDTEQIEAVARVLGVTPHDLLPERPERAREAS